MKAQKKIRTYVEATRSLHNARRDFAIIKRYDEVLQSVPVKLRQQDAQFLLDFWGKAPEGKELLVHWQEKTAEKRFELQKYIETVDELVRNWKPLRSALPKKKQRVLGMLPQI